MYLPPSALTVEKLGKGFYAVEVHYGFFENCRCASTRLENRPRTRTRSRSRTRTTFFVRHEMLVPARVSALAQWKRNLFIRIYRSAQEAAQFYRLPPGRVVELGAQTRVLRTMTPRASSSRADVFVEFGRERRIAARLGIAHEDRIGDE